MPKPGRTAYGFVIGSILIWLIRWKGCIWVEKKEAHLLPWCRVILDHFSLGNCVTLWRKVQLFQIGHETAFHLLFMAPTLTHNTTQTRCYSINSRQLHKLTHSLTISTKFSSLLFSSTIFLSLKFLFLPFFLNNLLLLHTCGVLSVLSNFCSHSSIHRRLLRSSLSSRFSNSHADASFDILTHSNAAAVYTVTAGR